MTSTQRCLVQSLALVFSLIITSQLYAQGTQDLLEMSLEDLLDIEITTAGKQVEKISDIPASVILITRKEIETYGYTSLEEILQNVPGL